MEHKIGIIGNGFLGQALVHGFVLHADIKIYDKYKDSDTLEDVVRSSDIIFLCLPTPMIKETGRYDLSILDENIKQINNLVEKDKILVIKSTVLPGTNRMFAEKYPNLKFVSNPEFLTARSNRLDFINASRIILGADEQDAVNKVKNLYIHRFGKSINIYTTSWEAAELTKLTANCFFALKVLYFNTIYDTCAKLNIDYDEVKDMVLADGRIGRSHCDVPGHDKFIFNGQVQRGISGFCFPKDLNAFINYMNDSGIDSSILQSAWDLNLQYRPSRDWEQLESATISLQDKNGKKNNNK